MSRRHLLASLAMVAVVVAVDLLSPIGAIYLGILVVAPLHAAAFLPPLHTAWVATATLAAAVVIGLALSIAGTLDFWLRFLGLALGGGLAVWLAGHLRRREGDLAAMSQVAEVVEQAILRPPPNTGPVRVAARYRSAAEAGAVGGDFYEAAVTPFGLRMVVGDVVGKGLGAVAHAVALLGSFREAAHAQQDLRSVVGLMNAAADREFEASGFATALLAEFHEGGLVHLVTCGHPAPFLVRREAITPVALTPTSPLGLDPTPVVESLTLGHRERLLLCTDGLLEARSPEGEPFELESLHPPLLLRRSLDDALDGVLEALDRHTGRRRWDDVCVLLVARR